MQNVHYLPAVPETEIAPRPHYAFDITQPDAGGFVMIDACVPMALAVEFMNLLTTWKPDA